MTLDPTRFHAWQGAGTLRYKDIVGLLSGTIRSVWISNSRYSWCNLVLLRRLMAPLCVGNATMPAHVDSAVQCYALGVCSW